MLNTVLFDFDGTLHETGRIFIAAFRKVHAKLREDGYTVRDYADEEIVKWLGINTPNMWKDFMPDLTQEETDKYIAYMMGNLDGFLMSEMARLYDGVEEMLTELKNQGRNLVILSNCTKSYRDTAWKRFDLGRWFTDYISCEDYDNIPKEHIFPFVAEKYEGDYIMIGDRLSDLRVALEHGLPSIGCLYGYGTEEELSVATAMVRTAGEIPKRMKEIEG